MSLEDVARGTGHVLVGYGHPNESRGPAPLPGTHHPDRLLVGGNGYSIFRGSLLVKEEWDAAEKWLKAVIDGEGNQ